MHLAAVRSVETVGPPPHPNLSPTLNGDRLLSEIVRPAFAHVGNSAELGSKERKGRKGMMKWQLVMDVKVERGSSSCALLVQRWTPEQTLDYNQVLNLWWGGQGGVLYDSLRSVYFTDGLFC